MGHSERRQGVRARHQPADPVLHRRAQSLRRRARRTTGSPSCSSEWCTCSPLPYSAVGLAMNVTTWPWSSATSRMHLLGPDDRVAGRQRVGGVQVDLELPGCGLVVPALDRDAEPVEPEQRLVDERQLLARVVVQVPERHVRGHRCEVGEVRGGTRVSSASVKSIASISNAALAAKPWSARPPSTRRRTPRGQHGMAAPDSSTKSHSTFAVPGAVGRGDERVEVGLLVDVAERVGAPRVPPREVRRAADVVAEHQLGDRVAARQCLGELRAAEVLAHDQAVERHALGLHPADGVLVEPAGDVGGLHVSGPSQAPEEHVDRAARELGEVLERADRVELALEHLLAEHGAAGEQRGERCARCRGSRTPPAPRRA